MKVVNQSILSTKHLLTTNSEVITFNPEFNSFFKMNGGEIYPFITDNDKVEDIEDYAIYIDPDDTELLDEMDYDSDFNTVISKFYIRDLKHPEKADIEIKPDEEKEIFITNEALELKKKGKGLIKFKNLDDDTKIFEMDIMNNELTKPLYEIMNLLNKNKADSIDETIDEVCQQFLELLIKSKIDASVIAAEMIINRLIRSVKHPLDRPDFSKDELEPYDILTVRQALENNGSPLIGLSFQDLKKQLLSDEIFEVRDRESYIDPFFKTDVSMKNLKKYSEICEKEPVKRRKYNLIDVTRIAKKSTHITK